MLAECKVQILLTRSDVFKFAFLCACFVDKPALNNVNKRVKQWHIFRPVCFYLWKSDSQSVVFDYYFYYDIIEAVILASNQSVESRVGVGISARSQSQSIPLTTTPTNPWLYTESNTNMLVHPYCAPFILLLEEFRISSKSFLSTKSACHTVSFRVRVGVLQKQGLHIIINS